MENRNTTNTTKNNNKTMSYENVLEKLEAISIKLESYNDYPQAASNNAKKAIKYKEDKDVEIEKLNLELDNFKKTIEEEWIFYTYRSFSFIVRIVINKSRLYSRV